MNSKTIRPFIIVYVIVALLQFVIKEFYPSQYLFSKPIFQGMVIGLLAALLFYYCRIFFIAWLRNRKEATAKSRVE